MVVLFFKFDVNFLFDFYFDDFVKSYQRGVSLVSIGYQIYCYILYLKVSKRCKLHLEYILKEIKSDYGNIVDNCTL